MKKHHLEIFADYNQFYVWDSGKDPIAPVDYTDEDVERRAKTAPYVIVVQPARNMTVPVDLELHEVDPGFDGSDWDHIVECSLELPTGKLQVYECTGASKLDLNIAPGTYRTRILFAGLGTLSENGLDGNDHYRIVLWPGTPLQLKVVKQWPS